jgi:hypothetical protein
LQQSTEVRKEQVVFFQTLLLSMALTLPGRQAPEVIPLEPGKPLRLRIATEAGGTGGTPAKGGVIIRIEIEGENTGGGGDKKPPVEESSLTKALRQIYDKEPEADKAKYAAALGKLYSWCEQQLSAGKFKTAGEFRDAYGAKSKELVPTDVLLTMRTFVRDQLRQVMPAKASSPLDKQTNSQAAQFFGALADSMEALSAGK